MVPRSGVRGSLAREDLVVGDAVDGLELAGQLDAAGGGRDAADAEQAGHAADDGLEGVPVRGLGGGVRLPPSGPDPCDVERFLGACRTWPSDLAGDCRARRAGSPLRRWAWPALMPSGSTSGLRCPGCRRPRAVRCSQHARTTALLAASGDLRGLWRR